MHSFHPISSHFFVISCYVVVLILTIIFWAGFGGPLIELLHSLCKLILFVLSHSGTIHSHEGPVHEERPGLCTSLLHNSTVHLQWPPGLERTDSAGQRHGWCESSSTLHHCLNYTMDFGETHFLRNGGLCACVCLKRGLTVTYSIHLLYAITI